MLVFIMMPLQELLLGGRGGSLQGSKHVSTHRHTHREASSGGLQGLHRHVNSHTYKECMESGHVRPLEALNRMMKVNHDLGICVPTYKSVHALKIARVDGFTSELL